MNNHRIVVSVTLKRTIRIMKIALLMLVICLSQVVAVTYAQTTKLSISAKDETLEKVLKQIERQSEFLFFYNLEEVNKNEKISINKKDSNIKDILDAISSSTGIKYTIRDRHIILSVANERLQEPQQGKKVVGVVQDAMGTPIIGANVVVKGTTNGTITDLDGRFSLDVQPDAVLLVTYIGYLAQEIPLKGQNMVSISLKEDTQALEEVVVVGYGTKRKGDITSAISVVDMDNIGDSPIVDPSRLIVGQAPGVVVKQTTGTPGKEMEITIRGLGSLGASSAPLYVIDGFPVGTSTQQSLNPNDIESISILKDAASTSIYGARGSNGVILITTKGAKDGELKLTASANLGIQSIPGSRRVKMMNGQEFAQFKNESFVDKIRYFEKREPSIEEIPIDFRYPEQTKYSTDWFDEIVNDNAMVQNYNVTLSEGMGKVKSVLSLGYLKQDGALIKTNFERLSARANITGEVNKYISVGWNINGSRTNERMMGSEGRDAIVGKALMADPREPVYNEDGTWNAYIGGHDGIQGYPNPVMELHQTQNIQHINRILSNGYVEISFLNDFKFKPSVNVSLINLKRRDFRPSTLAGNGAPPPRNATLTEWNAETVNWSADFLLSYTKKIKDHSISAMLGYTAQEENFDQLKSDGSKFPNDEIQIFQNAETISMNSEKYSWSLFAYFARADYNFKDKYLLSASFRREGSSRFGVDNRWGDFPSVSVGWRLSEESFMPRFSWLNNLKLRASYGITGNNAIGNYSSLSGMNSANYILGGSFAPGVTIGSFANSQLGWEKSRALDLGLDLSLFENQLAFTAEYYNKITESMLLDKEIPIISGFNNTFTNVGKVRNRGLEFAVDFKKAVNKDLSLRANFNISFNRNKVLEIRGENDYIEYFNFYNIVNRSVVGKPISMIYGYKCLGIFQSEEEIANSPIQEGAIPGVYKYWDANGDGEITYDREDMVEIGNPHPAFVWAFTLGGNYKNFDLNILFTGAQNYDMVRNIEMTTMNMDGVFNVLASAKNRFRSPENPGDGVGPTSNTWKWEREINSRYVYDASHAWLKSISLGYTIPRKSSILPGSRFYINAENLFLFTKYPGGNPDISFKENNSDLQIGRDDEAYPVPRVFSIGTVITF